MSGNLQMLDPNKITKPVNSTENQLDGHREIVFSVSPGEKQFWLKLQDSRHNWNNIPLGRVKSTAKGKYPKGSNVIVPVIPLNYTTPDSDPQQAQILRKGWLYVYRNGELWRELEVAGSGYLSDVNLRYNQKKDQRQATGHHDNRLLLPYKVMGELQAIEVAFSEVQWSWARIEMLQEDAELRRQRMQEVDLSGYDTRFEPLLPEGNKARVENVAQAPQLYHLALQRKSNIPVVYLHDPLRVATNLHKVFFTAFQEAAQFLEANARAKTLSDIADAILEAQPKYAEQLREAERQAFKSDYQSKEQQFSESYETANCDLLDYMQRQSTESASTVGSAFADFDLNLQSHRDRLEEIKAVLLTNLAVTEAGRQYITDQLEADESLLNQILAFKDKATAATDAIFNAVAAQLGAIDEKWSVVAAFVQRRYLLEISRTEMSLAEFLGSGQVLHSKVVQQAMKVNVVETATIAMRYEPPRVTGITIGGHNLSAYAKKVTTSKGYAKIIVGLEAYNLVNVIKDIVRHEDKFDPWVGAQFSANFLTSVAGIRSGYFGYRSASLLKQGLEKASKAAGRTAMKAGMVSAFFGAVYEVTQAFEESQSGDIDAAGSHGVMAGGALISGIGSILLLTAAVSNPIGWAVLIGGILVSVGGAISLLWTDNSPIEDWLLHGYWGTMAFAGEKEEKGKDGKKYLLDYTDWINDPSAELEAYYKIVYGFEVSTSWDQIVPNVSMSYIVAEDPFAGFGLVVEVPNYDPDKSRIFCELKFQVGDQWQDLISKNNQQPPQKRYGKPGEPRKQVWNFKGGQIPQNAKRAEATVWYDPFGDRSILMPDEFGLKIATRRFGSNAKEG